VFSQLLFRRRLLLVEPRYTHTAASAGVKMLVSMCFCVRWTSLGLPLLVVLALDVSGAAAPDGLVPSDNGITPRQLCGLRTCDLRTHYCDEVIGDCARCEDDCHPARIGGDDRATEDCQRICRWYYRFQRLQHKESPHETQVSSDDVAAAAAADGDKRQIGQMSRAELRMIIEMELQKSQTPSCLEKTFVILICFCVILLVARCWSCAGANQGQLKPRFVVEENLP